jgi:predicted transcriptional regulator of viral defense system
VPVLKHDVFFRQHPVFTGDELARHLARNGSHGVRTQERVLGYHIKAGRLRRIRQGMYAVIPPGVDGDTYPVDPYLVAAKMTPDAVLSHHTALEFHGRAYSVWQRFIYSAERPAETLTFRDQVFRGTKFPLALVRSGAEYRGVLTTERFGMPLRVASLERTLVDVLHRPDLAGGWEEVWRSLEVVEFFDLDEVVAYALLLDNATTAARVGFFLEQHRETLMVEDDHLKALEQCRPRQPHYLDRSRRRGGKLAAEWNLVVPEEVLTRSWEDVG